MKFYTIVPKNEQSFSRRWFVDEVGLQYVKNHYTNYPKDPSNPINRWDEFKSELTDAVWFDFGGMMHKNTPHIKEVMDGVTFEIPVTHIEYLLAALSTKELDDKKHWRCSTRFWNYVFTQKTKNKLKKIFTEKSKLYQEMIEGFNKDMDRALEEGRKAGKIIGMKKYHRGN